jgi:hypothetical protein
VASFAKTASACHIFGVSNWLKMLWVDTCLVSTAVVQLKIPWDFPNEVFVKESMGQSSSVDKASKLAVGGVRKDSALPQPASFGVDHIVDRWIGSYWRSPRCRPSASPPLIMLAAHASLEGRIPVGAITTDRTTGHVPNDTRSREVS